MKTEKKPMSWPARCPSKPQMVVFSEKEWTWLAKTGGITKREIEIMRLMFQWWDKRKVAQGLNIKYNTVRAHFSNIYKRTGTHKETELLLEMIRRIQNMPK